MASTTTTTSIRPAVDQSTLVRPSSDVLSHRRMAFTTPKKPPRSGATPRRPPSSQGVSNKKGLESDRSAVPVSVSVSVGVTASMSSHLNQTTWTNSGRRGPGQPNTAWEEQGFQSYCDRVCYHDGMTSRFSLASLRLKTGLV